MRIYPNVLLALYGLYCLPRVVLPLTAMINPSLAKTLVNCPIVRGRPVENSEDRRVRV